MTFTDLPDSNPVRDNILDHGQSIISRKGFSGVGLNEILIASGVPKGSFYHYFGSKEAFGEALLQRYFAGYLAELDRILSAPGLNMAQRLINYWQNWHVTQSLDDCQGKCLAVKLGAEVADLSEAMRMVMVRGTAGIMERIAQAIAAGGAEGSLPVYASPTAVAQALYQTWLGASLMAKVLRNTQPLEIAMSTTRETLYLSE